MTDIKSIGPRTPYRVEYKGGVGYAWLDITEVNVAYFKGQKDVAVFERQLCLGDPIQTRYVDRENVKITPDGYIASWLFLDPYIHTGVGSTSAVADDYLKESIPGGEKGVHQAHPKEGDKIKIKDNEYVWTRMNIKDLIDIGEIPQTQVAFGNELDIKCWGGNQVNYAGEYLVVYLLWKKDTTVTFTLGSDDSSESYFNDHPLTYKQADQDWIPDNGGTAKVNVKAGKWNTLLVGVYETGGEWGFSVKVDPIPDEIDNTGRAQAEVPTGTPTLSFDIEPKDKRDFTLKILVNPNGATFNAFMFSFSYPKNVIIDPQADPPIYTDYQFAIPPENVNNNIKIK